MAPQQEDIAKRSFQSKSGEMLAVSRKQIISLIIELGSCQAKCPKS